MRFVLLAMAAAMLVTGCGESKPPAASKANPVTVTGAPPEGSASVPSFVDVTADSGVDWTYRDGNEAGHAAILESLGGGVAVWDFELDGDLDLFFPGGGHYGPNNEILGYPSALFENFGPLKFRRATAAAGVGDSKFYSHGAQIGDFNSDGFPDLLLTGYGGLQLFHNQGDGTFHEIAQVVGLTDTLWSDSAAWADFNDDGHLDLYVVHYVDWSFANHPVCMGTVDKRDSCPPKMFKGLPDTMYYGNGDGTFKDVSKDLGLPHMDGKGLAVLAADVDLDGRTDVYVANDTVPKFLFRNIGQGRFEDISDVSGTAVNDMAAPDGSMGIDTTDFNEDGRPDLWVANYERESISLYRNEGDCNFLHVSRATGVTAVGGLFVSFGTVALDYDRDGDEDMFFSNGHVIRYPTNAPLFQTPILFENRNSRFFNVAPQMGKFFTSTHMGRGAARGDLDLDGDVDLVVSHVEQPAVLLENQTVNDNGWLRLRLIGTSASRDAVGAWAMLHTTREGKPHRQLRLVCGGGSYLSQSDPSLFWGIPHGSTIEKLVITWPGNKTQEIDGVQANQSLTIIQPP